ncbi:MAG: hypothetical protein R6W78_06010, partial [Bacteroidales bacterium]
MINPFCKDSRVFVLYIATFLIVTLTNRNAYGQKFLTDTLYVPFQADTNFRGQGLCIDSVHDQRIEDTHFVSYNTKKKFLIIPVDQEIHTTRPLSEILLESLAD